MPGAEDSGPPAAIDPPNATGNETASDLPHESDQGILGSPAAASPAAAPSAAASSVAGTPAGASSVAGTSTGASPAPAKPTGWVRSTGIRIMVGVLCGLLGFALVVQVQRTVSGDNLATARPDDLVQILDGLQRREDDLNAEIAALQDTLGRLRSSGASSEEALAEAERQAEALGILTGSVPATGPGVSMVIADPQNRIPPEVLLDAIQELRNAGAEAIQVGDVRIGVDSAFTGSAGAIKLDGTALTAPYRIAAIGDPPTLAAALAIPGGVLDTVRRAGGTMEVSQSDTVVIDQLRAPRTPLYARPADG